MLKILTILGTRPEIIRLSQTIKAFDECFDHILVHTGQNFDPGLNQVFFKDLSLRLPDYELACACDSAISTIASILEGVDAILASERPDAVVILGDTNSGLSALAAKKRQIPIFHLEAGNRCFDARVPEEINRGVIDRLADVNLCYSQIAREYLLKEGFDPKYVVVTGSPLKEVFLANSDNIDNSEIIAELNLEPKRYFLASVHRQENVDRYLSGIIEAFECLSDEFRVPVILSTHPRTRLRLKDLAIKADDTKVRLLDPLGFNDYNKLQKCSKCVLSDSGSVSEESSLLSFPAVNLRQSFERPEAFEVGSPILSGTEPDNIVRAVKLTLSDSLNRTVTESIYDYQTETFSRKVVALILSFIHVINRDLYKKWL